MSVPFHQLDAPSRNLLESDSPRLIGPQNRRVFGLPTGVTGVALNEEEKNISILTLDRVSVPVPC